MLRTVVAGVCFSFLACASVTAPLNIPLNANEVCAAEVQPPVPSSDDNPNIQPPVVLQRVAPQADAGMMGRSDTTAKVEAVIGADGVPRNICVVGGDTTWGRAVAEALQKWRFKPATLDEQPIPVRFMLTTNWRPN